MTMEKTGLVLEGGGYRGLYTSGVLDYFMEHNLYFNQVYGVSAGACNAIGYASKQPGRNAEVNFRFCSDKRYASYSNLLRVRGIFDMEFVFEEIPQKYLPFDYETFFSSEVKTNIGVTSLITGKSIFYPKEQMDRRMLHVRASCAVPLASHIYYLNGIPCLDGGTANPIPIGTSLNKGNHKNVIILTQDPTYEKKVTTSLPVVRRVYRQYPNFIRTVERRHLLYNRQRQVCRFLQKTGQAIVLQPKQPVNIRSLKAELSDLQALYQAGYQDAKENFENILAFLEK